MRACLIQENDGGGTGGGLSFAGVRGVMVSNNTLTGNRADGHGAGVIVKSTNTQSSSLNFVSNLVTWSKGSDGLSVETTGSTFQYNSVFFTSTGVNYAGQVTSGTGGNNEVDPQFVQFDDDGDPSDDDLRLRSTSPAINSGSTDSAWNDPDGSRNDRGAYGGPQALSR